MNRSILLLVCLLGSIFTLQAQEKPSENTDREVIMKINKRYYYQGERIRYKQIGMLLESDPEAHRLYRAGKLYDKLAIGAGVSSLILIYQGFDKTITEGFGDSSNKTGSVFLLAGVSTLSFGIVSAFIGGHKRRKGVDMFNKNRIAPPKTSMSISMGLNPQGNGLSLKFRF